MKQWKAYLLIGVALLVGFAAGSSPLKDWLIPPEKVPQEADEPTQVRLMSQQLKLEAEAVDSFGQQVLEGKIKIGFFDSKNKPQKDYTIKAKAHNTNVDRYARLWQKYQSSDNSLIDPKDLLRPTSPAPRPTPPPPKETPK